VHDVAGIFAATEPFYPRWGLKVEQWIESSDRWRALLEGEMGQMTASQVECAV
jgi:hypothetical protein